MRNMKNMRVLHLSLTARRGGAAQAAWRLHRALRNDGFDSKMLVSETNGLNRDDGVYGPTNLLSVFIQRLRKNIEIQMSKKVLISTSTFFSRAFVGANWERRIRQLNPDLIHLHWINYGHVSLDAISRWGVPIVWSLHDEWPFTGGCHFANDCSRFHVGCGGCPLLRNSGEMDTSRKLILRKKKALKDLSLHLIAPSQWMASRAHASQLFEQRAASVIPNGVDTHLFGPRSADLVRQRLGIPQGVPCFLFIAANAVTDPRKGFNLLAESLTRLKSEFGRDVHLLIVGSSGEQLPTLNFPVKALGVVSEPDRVVDAYCAADALVVPSLSDNLPNTVLESFACGTPVLAFPSGGIPEMILPHQNGNLSESVTVEGLTKVMNEFLMTPESWPELRKGARDSALERYSLELQSRRVIELYRSLFAL